MQNAMLFITVLSVPVDKDILVTHLVVVSLCQVREISLNILTSDLIIHLNKRF